ncbi:nucleotidyl transferase AbiEii/AbiGii toxin family protein [Flavobacterium jejuense]|uniref:Nucleotidyl transferase AbiEii/AbiGii toxin family protein n=1 Tax=Flavobacterium jejuense TaxID=1544455 RepID=A0ABX0IS96_9FLAO|nr:nucleotidyl transferase AbiEii/AbiGii toxin family protein [Flavobacterium jejuense]NHN24986.1 nucleotidyl transferase AbiEii/AbiGii toxin family protein [Flavobacterium jejuense]
MLYYNTVNELLKNTLITVMNASIFDNFRLVGGTALSLQIGHRESIDIDLFSDADYGSINFEQIDSFLKATFNYVDSLDILPALGKSYFIGDNEDNTIKLDIFYTDPFVQPYIEEEGIRMASIEEIIAMKVDVIQRVGRKKDFWDLHDLLESYNITQMLDLHEQRYPYAHDKDLIIKNFTNFDQADDDFDPICFKGKYWEFIKEDFEEVIKNNF